MRRREDRRTAAQRRSLLTLAARAEDAEPDARPGLQAFLASLRAAAPTAALGTIEAPGRPLDPLTALLADGPGRSAAPDEASVAAAVGAADLGPTPSGPSDALHASWSSGGRPVGGVVIDAPTAGETPDPPRPPSDPGLGPDTAGQLFRDLARLRPDGSDRPPTDRRRWAATVAAVAALGLASFAGLSVLRGGDGGGSTTPPDEPARANPAAATAAPEPTGRGTAVSGATPTGAPAAGAAPVVEHDGRRYAVGEPGDLATVGDWACDGRPRVVLYRPTSGSLFVFAGWPDAGGSVETRAVTAVPGGTALATERRADGCPTLTVTGGGPTVDIDPELLR